MLVHPTLSTAFGGAPVWRGLIIFFLLGPSFILETCFAADISPSFPGVTVHLGLKSIGFVKSYYPFVSSGAWLFLLIVSFGFRRSDRLVADVISIWEPNIWSLYLGSLFKNFAWEAPSFSVCLSSFLLLFNAQRMLLTGYLTFLGSPMHLIHPNPARGLLAWIVYWPLLSSFTGESGIAKASISRSLVLWIIFVH